MRVNIFKTGSCMKCEEDFYLGFSPERVDPGNLINKTKNTPKVVGAISEGAPECIAAVYEAVFESGDPVWRAQKAEWLTKGPGRSYESCVAGYIRYRGMGLLLDGARSARTASLLRVAA